MNEMKRRIKASHCAVNCALTDRLGLEQLRGAALSFALSINGRQLHLVAALRFQARYRHLVDEVCYNIRDGTVSVEKHLDRFDEQNNKRIPSRSNNACIINR